MLDQPCVMVSSAVPGTTTLKDLAYDLRISYAKLKGPY